MHSTVEIARAPQAYLVDAADKNKQIAIPKLPMDIRGLIEMEIKNQT